MVLPPMFLQAIGLCTTDPNNLLDLPYDGVVKNWSECCEFWILSENKVYCNKENETRPNLSIYNPKSSKIGCSVNEKGYLEFHMDGKNHGVVWSKPLPMDRPLWGFVDLPIEYKIQACFTHGEQDDTKSILMQNNYYGIALYCTFNIMLPMFNQFDCTNIDIISMKFQS